MPLLASPRPHKDLTYHIFLIFSSSSCTKETHPADRREQSAHNKTVRVPRNEVVGSVVVFHFDILTHGNSSVRSVKVVNVYHGALAQSVDRITVVQYVPPGHI